MTRQWRFLSFFLPMSQCKLHAANCKSGGHVLQTKPIPDNHVKFLGTCAPVSCEYCHECKQFPIGIAPLSVSQYRPGRPRQSVSAQSKSKTNFVSPNCSWIYTPRTIATRCVAMAKQTALCPEKQRAVSGTVAIPHQLVHGACTLHHGYISHSSSIRFQLERSTL